jgi:hypothetical protein
VANPAVQNPLAQANNNAANLKAEELQTKRQEQAAQVAQANQTVQAGNEARTNQANQTDQANRANQAAQRRTDEQDERTNNNIQQGRQADRDNREAANLAANQNTYAPNPTTGTPNATQMMGTVLDMRA